jgi:hypothetical protein
MGRAYRRDNEMSVVLSETHPIAQKDYPCDASHWLHECDGLYGLSMSEKRAIVKAKRNGWKIKKGERYVKQANIWCGDFCQFRAIPAIHDICLKHDLYDEP